MPNFNLLAYKEIDRRLYLSSLRLLPLQLFFLPVILPTLLFVVIIVELRRTQGSLNLFKFYLEPEPSTETSDEYQGSESAAPAPAPAPAPSPASTRPHRPRCTCSCHRANGSTSKRAVVKSSLGSRQSTARVDSVPPPDSADPSSPLGGDSEGYETAAEEAAPAKNTIMQGAGATAPSGDEIRRHNDAVSQQTSTTPDAAVWCPALNNGQPRNSSNEEDDEAEKIRRRNIKMREEGVRVKIAYAQLTAPSAPPQDCGSSTAATAGSFSSSSSGPQTPPTPTGSSPASGPFQSPAPLLQAPAHTPTDTPPKQQVVTKSVLPTSGEDAAAGPALVEIREKLLAVPADAVSRRLLRDGRAFLHRRVRTPRSSAAVSFVDGGDGGDEPESCCSRQSPAVPAAEEGGQPGSGYPSDLME